MPNVKAAQEDIYEAVKPHVLPKPVTQEPEYVDLSLITVAKQRIDKEK